MTVLTAARMSNQTFPFVVIPEFGMHVVKTQSFTGAIATYFNPIVTFDQRLEWERFSSRNGTALPSYVDTTIHLQDKWNNFLGPRPQLYDWPSSDVIWGDDMVNGGSMDIPYNLSRSDRLDVHIPVWQVFPVVMSSYYPANWGKFL